MCRYDFYLAYSYIIKEILIKYQPFHALVFDWSYMSMIISDIYFEDSQMDNTLSSLYSINVTNCKVCVMLQCYQYCAFCVLYVVV